MRRPPNERERVARLKGLEILDSGPERAFDELVSIAAAICEAPTALISLIDEERQWFKARLQFDKRFTPRKDAFCAETILSDSLLIIEDATKDPRFSSNPFVTEKPFVRFYAGAPLITDDQLVIGSLCILDYKPRTLSPAQQSALMALARQVVAQIELRRKLLAVKSTIDTLGESERRFRLIADASPVLMWISDQAGNRTFSNAAWCEFTGLSREDSIADSWKEALHPDDRDAYNQKWSSCARHGGRFQREFRLRHASGTYRWVLEQSIPLQSSAGRIEAYVSSCVDLSSRNAEELEDQNNEARFRAVSEAAPLGIFVTDSAGNFTYTNHQFQRISGQKVEESLGSGWLRAIPPEDRDRVSKSWYDATQTAKPFEETYRYKRPDGEISWCSVKAAAINTTDTVSGWVGTVEDITELRRASEEILAAKQSAEAAMHAKSQFLANMSHEIRTPLTAIVGFAESLRDDLQEAPQQLHTVDIILGNSKHLLDIINDILDLSKIDAGALHIDKANVSLVRLLDDVRTMFAPRIAEKALSFSVQYEWPLPEQITTDPLRLKQVLINLLSNAIKFTEKGWIELRVRFDPKTTRLSFAVSDSGIGIAQENIPSLFKPFCQENESITRKYGGSGLGLSISRRLVHALGGEISISSRAGVGSSFEFWIEPNITGEHSLIRSLPAEPQETPREALPCKFSGRVLFADDALDNRRLVHHLLEKAGINAVLVEDGKQAIDAVMAQPFDLILLDIQMPNLDGLSAARSMRQAGLRTPIVALSAGAMTTDVLKAIEAGCSMHLSKPFSKDSFHEMLRKFLSSPAAPESPHLNATPIRSSRAESDEDTIPLVLDFVSRLPEKVHEIRKASDAGTLAELAALAHKLRGSSGLYGYAELCELCGELEKNSKSGNLSGLPSLVARIEDLLPRIELGKPSWTAHPAP